VTQVWVVWIGNNIAERESEYAKWVSLFNVDNEFKIWGENGLPPPGSARIYAASDALDPYSKIKRARLEQQPGAVLLHFRAGKPVDLPTGSRTMYVPCNASVITPCQGSITGLSSSSSSSSSSSASLSTNAREILKYHAYATQQHLAALKMNAYARHLHTLVHKQQLTQALGAAKIEDDELGAFGGEGADLERGDLLTEIAAAAAVLEVEA